jgi:hypothetical protein
MNVATKTWTVSPFWFLVVTLALTTPCVGLDFDGRTSMISLST